MKKDISIGSKYALKIFCDPTMRHREQCVITHREFELINIDYSNGLFMFHDKYGMLFIFHQSMIYSLIPEKRGDKNNIQS